MNAETVPQADLASLEGQLSSWIIRLRLLRAWRSALWGLVFGLAVALGFSLAALLQAGILRQEMVRLVGLASLAGAIAFGLAGYFWPISRLKAARSFDRLFSLRERVSTALESASLLPPDPESAEIFSRQLADALESARKVQPGRYLPLRLNRSPLLFVTGLIVAFAAIAVLGEPLFQSAQRQREIQQAVAQEIVRIELLRSEIQADPLLEPELRQQLDQILERSLQELNNSKTLEQAISTLAEAESQLDALSPDQAQVQSLHAAGSTLSQAAESPLQPAGEALLQGDFQSAAQHLKAIDLTALSAEQQASTAQELQDLAEALQATYPVLADAFNQAAAALQNGDPQRAEQALQAAAQALAQQAPQLAQSEAASRLAAQLNQEQEYILQAAAASPGQASGFVAAGSSNTQSGSEASGASQEQNTGSNVTGSSGAGQGESSGVSSPGPAAGDTPIDQNNTSGDEGARTYEPIYAPQRLGGTEGEPVLLPDSGQPGDQPLGPGQTVPGLPGESQVPYSQVYSQYAQAYRQAIESGQVPVTLRELVRRYFSALEP